MGWAMLLGLAVLAFAGLWFGGFPRRLWTIPATALTLGAAGYAWQGSPDQPGHPVAAVERKGEIDPGLIEIRETMFGRYNTAYSYFGMADAMTRIGARDSAVRAMLGAVQKEPKNAGLWTWLGVTLAEHDGGMVSPASAYAFRRAMELAPDHPGPPFFMGLAQVKSGQFAAARPLWERAVALSPADASYRSLLEAQLARLDEVLAAGAGQGAPAGPPEPAAPEPANGQAAP
ncbi:tetratricopeptide repeat protein [Sphingomonas canadensis]|uniref:Tetratricopeptide repeat protein n=1 Tax=Sphingomonas canadensis TaxID=1219257 RepID=A0ABW3H8L1_9SPHN|nr:cytochrome c biogenesis factor-like protein [Sphingomonas canadensis]MCW3835547.1 cytochrome c biogenesis factor-like protein [Sphingomonas canadensis]